MLTIEDLKKQGLIAYTYLRGSHSQNLNNEDSDIDLGGVYFAPMDILFGLGDKYQEEVSDEKHDETYFEFGKWMRLLAKGNPNALESLYANEKTISGKVHPAIQQVILNRDKFLSKEVVNSLAGYAYNQIRKARGLGKKITTAHELGDKKMERKDILDFCYVADRQGSKPVKKFLEENHLDQKYCGVVNIPNMPHTYGVYYDFAAYFKFENRGLDECFGLSGMSWLVKSPYCKFLPSKEDAERVIERLQNKEFFHYGGIVHPDDFGKSNEVRLSSIPKGEEPIFIMQYNKDAYTSHCKEYKEYKEWEAKRNPVRYEGNLGHNYDAKNVMHCMRLVRMAKELAQGKGFNVVRTYDRDYLLDIRNHKFEYEEVMAQLEKEKAEMEAAIATCTLRDIVDYEAVNELLVQARKRYVFYEQ